MLVALDISESQRDRSAAEGTHGVGAELRVDEFFTNQMLPKTRTMKTRIRMPGPLRFFGAGRRGSGRSAVPQREQNAARPGIGFQHRGHSVIAMTQPCKSV